MFNKEILQNFKIFVKKKKICVKIQINRGQRDFTNHS